MQEAIDHSVTASQGVVIAIRGSVVDARFEQGLPPIQSVLRAGMRVENTGGTLEVPVGKTICGRMFDVFGHAIDGLPERTEVSWRTIHRPGSTT
jgi:F-type H+-transporting ATPase subunit beta